MVPEYFKNGLPLDSNKNYYNIEPIINWLYIYKLTNLTIPNYEITKTFFNKKNLDKVINWVK